MVSHYLIEQRSASYRETRQLLTEMILREKDNGGLRI